MHELGIVFEVVNRVRSIVSENDIPPEEVAVVALEVGEASSVIPHFLYECWPAAIDGTEFEHVQLRVDEVIATVCCKECGTVYEYINNDKKCPKCGSEECYLVNGKEFNIKEILLFEAEDEDVEEDTEVVEETCVIEETE